MLADTTTVPTDLSYWNEAIEGLGVLLYDVEICLVTPLKFLLMNVMEQSIHIRFLFYLLEATRIWV